MQPRHSLVIVSVLAASVSLGSGVLAARPGGRPSASQSTLVVPTTRASGWEVLRYGGIPPHEVSFSAAGMRIGIVRSAGPVVYALSEPVRVVALRVGGRIEGSLRVPPGRQGETGFDDYALRAGLVLTGTRRLRLSERLFAPAWLKALFGLAPPGVGISEVRFFNVAADASHVGAERRHPLHDLLVERVVTAAQPDGAFEIRVPLGPADPTVALWLGADGDDTGSAYAVVVERIELTLAPSDETVR